MLGLGIGFGLAFFVVFIPVSLLAMATGGGLAYAIYMITNSVPLALLVGLPPSLLILVVPLVFLQGLYRVFESSTWTLTYRDVLRGSAQPAASFIPELVPA
jgi:hypothetical protein